MPTISQKMGRTLAIRHAAAATRGHYGDEEQRERRVTAAPCELVPADQDDEPDEFDDQPFGSLHFD